MEKKSNKKKQLHEKIERALDLYEKENEQRNAINAKMEKEIKEYYQQGIKNQQEYIDHIKSIINLKNVEQCEDFINRIANDIPKYITMDEVYPFLKELAKSTEEEYKKSKKIDLKNDEVIREVLSNDQRSRFGKLQNEEKQQNMKSYQNFQIMVETIYPLNMLSADKWGFLWNLASWKSNLLLTKQMKNYTYWVMILTGVVVFFSILLVIVSFIK